jgi:arylsulfatase A-like enzyme
MPDQPNVLLIQSDQHRFDALETHSDREIETPNFNRLVEEGMDFTSAFTPIPLCTPARASLLTGQWPTSHLGMTNYQKGHEIPRTHRSDVTTFSEVLANSGYELGYIGRWHVHPKKSPHYYGFDSYVSNDEYQNWRQKKGLPPSPSTDYFGGSDENIEPEESRLAWGADRVIEQLEGYAEIDDPFFLRWDTYEPHFPNIVPEPYASMYDPADIEPWDNFEDDLADKPLFQRQQRKSWGLENWSWEDWAPVIGRYLGEVSLLDAQIGRILDRIDELGLEDDLLVIYTADHGEMGGSHGLFDKQGYMYDEIVQVPLIARWPDRIAAGEECDAFISHGLDIAATLCDLCAGSVPESFQGQSLRPLFDGEGADWRQGIVSVYHGNTSGLYSERMYRTDRWKYVWNPTARDELYDLEEDPGEVTNLAQNTEYDEILADLRPRLLSWMEETEDTLLNNWTRTQLRENLSI